MWLVAPTTENRQQLSIISFLFNLLYQRLRFAQLPSIPLWTPSGKPHAGRRAYLTSLLHFVAESRLPDRR